MFRRSPLAVMAALALCLATAGALGAAEPKARPGQPAPKSVGGIYKWVDEDGVTHYGQNIPPEYRNNAAEEMNRRGLTVRRIAPARTPEERQALEEKAQREQEERKRLAEQRRRDRALINTYESAEEIDQARDRNLAVPVQALRNLEPRMKKAQARLARLQAQRDELTNAGKAVPDWLQEDITAQQMEVQAVRADMDRQSAQIETIRTRYETDRKRFIELTEARSR